MKNKDKVPATPKMPVGTKNKSWGARHRAGIGKKVSPTK